MALTSSTQIGRLALSHVGGGTIESLDEKSPQAKQLKRWYDVSRLETLEAFDWNFARKRQTLALHGDAAPEGQWTYRYQYPADCVRARLIVNPTVPAPDTSINLFNLAAAVQGADAVPFSIEDSSGTRSILTNLEEAVLVYTYDLTNTNLFSMQFINAFSYNLAAKIAYPLTRKRQIANENLQLFFNMIEIAQAHNANEGVAPPPREAEWIRGR